MRLTDRTTHRRTILTTIAAALLDDPLPILQDARKGCDEALAELTAAILPVAYRTAVQLTRDPAAAEDLAQEATLRVIGRIDHYNPKWKLRTWVRVITRNLFIDGYRKQRRRSYSVVPDLACPKPPPDEIVASSFANQAVRDAVGRLPAMYRQVIEMHHFQHMKYREIADHLDIPIGTVMNRIHRARQKMRDALAPMAA